MTPTDIIEADLNQDDQKATKTATVTAHAIGELFAKALRPRVVLAAFTEDDGGVELVVHSFLNKRRVGIEIESAGTVRRVYGIGRDDKSVTEYGELHIPELAVWIGVVP